MCVTFDVSIHFLDFFLFKNLKATSINLSIDKGPRADSQQYMYRKLSTPIEEVAVEVRFTYIWFVKFLIERALIRMSFWVSLKVLVSLHVLFAWFAPINFVFATLKWQRIQYFLFSLLSRLPSFLNKLRIWQTKKQRTHNSVADCFAFRSDKVNTFGLSSL